MIKTKSIRDPIETDDGIRILITRFHPRGYSKDNYDIWYRELSPSERLLYDYKNGKIKWKQFVAYFVEEMKDHKAIQFIESLKILNQTTNITLLCYEKEGDNCHRYIVKDLIEK